ncbi:Stromal cell-derived factor 2-like protein [Drosera capensis]
MGLSCFAFSLFLYLSLGPSEYPSADAAATESVEITYGTVLKLMHEKTKFRLHSHEVPYGSGSGQQSVTGFPDVDDANSYWRFSPKNQPQQRPYLGLDLQSHSPFQFWLVTSGE